MASRFSSTVAIAVTALALTALTLSTIALSSSPSAASVHTPAGHAVSLASAAKKPATKPATKPAKKPNIVFVLTDDLSWNLVKYMPHVRQLEQNGTTFNRYYVTDSLCCPSRSSIFTGEYPHDTGVFGNSGSDGGFNAFQAHGDAQKCFAPALQKAGYRTGFMGKYLNGYLPEKSPTPPGWNTWVGAGDGYAEYNYNLNVNGKFVHHGHKRSDYLTGVLNRQAQSYIASSAKSKKPFMLEVATFAPHNALGGPPVPAQQDLKKFPHITEPRTPAFNHKPKNAPTWMKQIKPLTKKNIAQLNRQFRKRVQAVQAVDRMVGDLEAKLKATGQANNTDFVFSSDNGFHLGQHGLRGGKKTAFENDIRVPLIVSGPGVPKGAKVQKLAENIDLNPTFVSLAGAKPAKTTDGVSLVPLLHGQKPKTWRQAVLIEHHRENQKNDPDKQPKSAGDPPNYEGIRTANALYVEYRGGDREYYQTQKDPHELDNTVKSLPKKRLSILHRTLVALEKCHGTAACRVASQLKH